MFYLEVGDLLWTWVVRAPEARSVCRRVRGGSPPGKILKKWCHFLQFEAYSSSISCKSESELLHIF